MTLTFDGQADGNILHVYHKTGPVPPRVNHLPPNDRQPQLVRGQISSPTDQTKHAQALAQDQTAQHHEDETTTAGMK
jgi:hypothetical protein